MIRLNLILRGRTNKLGSGVSAQRFLERCFSTKNDNASTSSNGSSSNDEQKKANDKIKSTEALQKLNLLLDSMIKDDIATKKQPKLDLAKPKNQRQKKPETDSVKSEPVENQVIKAAKDVAESIGGDVQQTESELLQKLLNPDKEEAASVAVASLNEIFKDMKIDREAKTEQVSRAHQVRQLLQTVKASQQTSHPKVRSRRPPRQRQHDEIQVMEERVDLFGSEHLGIFPSLEEVQKWPEQELNKTWQALHERELRLAVTHPPSNYFQQMILWTKQGKIWKFPIDNEQGLEAEKSVYFTEHVFLEKHVESWCPPKGPLRHFMELVCVGLSKNPYLTVEKKKEHIEWFRNYFIEKKKLLTEVGAIPPGFDIDKESTKKIDA